MPAVDPWSAGIMAAGSIASGALRDSTPQSQNNSFASGYDNSGFVVNIGSGSASASIDKSASPLAGLLKNPVLLIALALGAYLVMKRT